MYGGIALNDNKRVLLSVRDRDGRLVQYRTAHSITCISSKQGVPERSGVECNLVHYKVRSFESDELLPVAIGITPRLSRGGAPRVLDRARRVGMLDH